MQQFSFNESKTGILETELKHSIVLRCIVSFELLRWHTNCTLKLQNPSLHLKQASIGRISVIIEHIDLSVQFHKCLLLILMLPLDLLPQLVLFVQGSVFVFDDVHLKDCPSGVLFSLYDFHLSAVVLDLGDDVDEDLFEAFQLPPESHLLLALQTKNGL